MQALKINFSAPSAHYRIPHSNNPHATYLLPPFSTVIGLLANILGERQLIDNLLAADFGLGIHSSYETLSREYVWYRNISADAHKGRYVIANQRQWQERPDHLGGQSPITVEVLNNVHLTIYLVHPDLDIAKQLINMAHKPERWLSHLHLGRAEDWAVIENIKMVELVASNETKYLKNVRNHYQWLPQPDYAWEVDQLFGYDQFFAKCNGVLNLITSRYRLVSPETGKVVKNAASAIRNFDYIKVKLMSGPLPFINWVTLPQVWVDPEAQSPVYLTRIGKGCCDE